MPACEPWCPIVRIELKKIVAQAPWIRDEQLETASVKVREAAPSLKADGEKLLTGPVDEKWGDQERRPAAGDLFDSQHHPAPYSHQDPESWLNVMDAVDVKSAKESREILSHDQTVLERKTRSATHSAQSVGTITSKAVDSAVSATVVGPRADGSVVSSVSRAAVSTKGTVTGDTTGLASDEVVETDSAIDPSRRHDRMDREAIAEGREGPATFPDECEPTCPRRISRENRIRKLEERQSTVDAYLLNKGTNYFDDIRKRMSWFDATGFANLAKSALKEAQKTIDKALDIKEEDQKLAEGRAEETSDFFKSWGLKSNEELESSHGKGEDSKQETTSGIWGSFTGSFFEPPKLNEPESHRKYITHSTSLQSTSIGDEERPRLISSSSFSEDDKGRGLSPWKDASRMTARKQKYAVHKTQNVPAQTVTETSTFNLSNETDPAGSIVTDDAPSSTDDTSKDRAISNAETQDAIERSSDEKEDSVANEGESKCEGRDCREEESSGDGRRLNRMSFASSENDKKSFESVEILGSRSNTDCTTTPDSDGNSLTNSGSPSGVGAKVTSESVEILPDSLVTSPSSVEILGDWKSDGSPYLSPSDPRQYETSPGLDRDDSVTPCWEDSDVVPIDSRDARTDPSSSDVSPYESPIEETKTPRDDSCSSSIDSTPSTGTYPVVCSGTAMVSESRLSKPLSSTKSEDVETTTARDTDEPDEPTSFTEDSYTSVSESTVMMTLQTLQQKEQVAGRIEIPGVSSNDKMHDSCPDAKETPLKDSMAEIRLNLSLDTLKETDSLHLPIEAITTQPIRKTECLDGAGKAIETDLRSFDRLINTTIEPAEPDRYSVDEILHSLKLDTLDQTTDQHLISTDSSCEGTLIESSSEENPSLIRKPEGNASQASLTSSSYVKTMLADAMIEKSEAIELDGQSTEMPRDNSPISSESRSDLVKIGSDQTSGHTSGDELETTTSSDIEIISRYSPNGDSSSTQSRQSLAKLPPTKGSDLLTKALKTRGHSRELSEISVGSDEANLEIEKLLKRIQEMTEILEARESKLIDVSRMNMELHEQNNSLKKQLDSFVKHAEQSQNLNQITDEYMQRLSALESKFQQTIRERDSLRKNLEQLKVEAATRLSSQEIFTLSAEKDEIIKELREEGEKLSKQQLQHSNIIKKLRAKEKENDALVKSQKEQIEEQTSELERLKRSLHAKEEVERTQIEAVHTLTAKTKKQEKEILTLQERLENALHKMDAYKNSLDAAKMDLAETKKLLAATELELKDATTNAGESCQLLAQVEELKIKLRESEETHVKKEVFFKHENSELLKRLEAAEARSEELSESVSTATKPLLRQLEQLQANLLHKSHSFAKQEKALSEKNLELQAKVDSLIETDRYFKEENVNFKSKISQLESKLAVKEVERNQLQELYDQLMAQKEKLVEQTAWYRQKSETLQQSHASQIMEMNREIVALENKLAVEKAATDAERRKNHTMSKQRQNVNEGDGDGDSNGGDDDDGDDDGRFSPATTAKHHSTNRINIWPLGNSAENSSERYATVYDSIRTGSNSTSVFENLQAQLKQKDGEIQQLQWELSRRNTERDALNTELSTLTLKIEELNNKVSNVTVLNESLHEIQTRYDALLQMYGEKMEENQELRLDLQDIKEMYKIQIDQLLKRDA